MSSNRSRKVEIEGTLSEIFVFNDNHREKLVLY